jgi:hypothetical protein
MKALKALMVFGLTAITGAAGASVVPREEGVNAKAAFERLKTLQGTWESAGTQGQKATTTFELVARGTVLSERYANPALPGGGEMLTAYHVDGDALMLTHYCIANNQPTLRAARFDAGRGEFQFEFVRAANLASADAGHMRRARYQLDDANHFVTEWEYYENGKLKFTETERFTRVR